MNIPSVKLHRTLVLAAFCVVALVAFGQRPNKQIHSWDIFMNDPEAKAAAAKLIGHCGEAETQAVMNACFASEFKNADEQMTATYRSILKGVGRGDRQLVRAAQRAWLQYRDLHCRTVGSLQAGGGSLEPTEVFSCKADLTKARTKEIESGYRSLESSSRREQ